MGAILNKLIDWSKTINLDFDRIFKGTQKLDLWFIGGFVLMVILSALFLKRRRMVILALAIYTVTALYQALPFDWGITYGNNMWIFLGAVTVVFLLLINTIGKGYNSIEFTGRIKSFLFSFIVLGFLVSSGLNFVFDVSIIGNISLVDKLFSGDISRGVWAVLPLVGFVFLR